METKKVVEIDLEDEFITPYVLDINTLARLQMDTLDRGVSDGAETRLGRIRKLYALANAIYRTSEKLSEKMYAAQGLQK